MTTILLVGEAFGAEEEKQGTPFVGRSGQLLRKALMEAGVEDYELTNVCMFRPPNNRKPTEEEIEAELPRLRQELSRYDNIISLGITSRDVLSKVLGDKTFYFMYHPAYILRDMSKYDKYVEGFRVVKYTMGRGYK